MQIQSSNFTINNTNFRSKNKLISDFLNSEKINDKISQINKSNESKALFEGLSAIAVSAIAGITLAVENNESAKEFFNHVFNDLGLKSNDKNIFEKKHDIDISKLINENPKRSEFLKIVSFLPNLNTEYKNLLERKINEPENNENNFSLEMIEALFSYLSDPDKLNYTKSYFQTLNENADVLDKIAINLASTLKNGNSMMYYMVLLNNSKLKKEDIELWAKANNLSCDEFMMLKEIGEETILKLNNVKKNYNNKFNVIDIERYEKEENAENYYNFKLNFSPDAELIERFKIVSDVHEAINGNICFHNEIDKKSEYIIPDIQRELLDNIVKDRRMDATFSFVKYINPSALEKFNLTAQDVKFLSKDSEIYKQISRICKDNVTHLDYENQKLKDFGDVMRKDDLFGGLFETNHSKMRFITRFVLKNDPNPENLYESCKSAVDTFIKESMEASDKCKYSCYIHSKGHAPQFFLGYSSLGNYIKVTLNSEGKIHTMYEDIRKELQRKNSK